MGEPRRVRTSDASATADPRKRIGCSCLPAARQDLRTDASAASIPANARRSHSPTVRKSRIRMAGRKTGMSSVNSRGLSICVVPGRLTGVRDDDQESTTDRAVPTRPDRPGAVQDALGWGLLARYAGNDEAACVSRRPPVVAMVVERPSSAARWALNFATPPIAWPVRCSALFAKPLLFTLTWRFVSPHDGGATPPIQ